MLEKHNLDLFQDPVSLKVSCCTARSTKSVRLSKVMYVYVSRNSSTTESYIPPFLFVTNLRKFLNIFRHFICFPTKEKYYPVTICPNQLHGLKMKCFSYANLQINTGLSIPVQQLAQFMCLIRQVYTLCKRLSEEISK